MKATELIEQLTKLIKKHGDCEVFFEYDQGIRIRTNTIDFFEQIRSNAYSDYWPALDRVFLINYDGEE